MNNQVEIFNSAESINICLKEGREMASISISLLSNKKTIDQKEYENVWYFNRLFVPVKLRNRGFATILLKALKEILVLKKIVLICDINPYGDLSYNQLKKMYIKNGFKKVSEGDFLVFNK